MDQSEKLLQFKPRISPSVHLLTRSKTEIQLGLDPNNSIRMPTAFREILNHCNGSTKISEILEMAQKNEIDTASTLQILKLLIELNLLVIDLGGLKTLSTNEISHLNDAQRSTINQSNATKNRIKARITIIGAGRIGSTLALLLGNSGFANLRIIDYQLTKRTDLLPWGASRVDVGIRRDYVTQTLLERVYPGQLKSMRLKESLSKPDLFIFAPDPIADFPWLSPELADKALRTDTPFIVVASCPTSSIITSILYPGISGCIRCYHHSQIDRDPAWLQLTTQLIGRVIPDPTPVDLVLQTAHFAFNVVTNWIDTKENSLNTWWQYSRQGISEFENYLHVNCGCIWQLTQTQVVQ